VNEPEEYWDCDNVRLSDRALGNLLFQIVVFRGAILDAYWPDRNRPADGLARWRQLAHFRIRLPRGQRAAFETAAGLCLKPPPRDHWPIRPCGLWDESTGEPLFLAGGI
jgi:hypothetical protein